MKLVSPKTLLAALLGCAVVVLKVVLYLSDQSWLTSPVVVSIIADLLVVGFIVMSLFALRRLFQEMETAA